MGLLNKKDEKPTLNTSLLTAYTYLLQRMERTFDATALAQNLSDLQDGEDPWLLLTLADPQLKVAETGDFGTWPASNNAVIRFRVRGAGTEDVDYFCAVADAGDRQIIDSDTGALKNGNVHGQPVEWATFAVGTTDSEDEPLPKEKDSSRYYTVLKGGESPWDIALKLKISATELIEHNDLDTAAKVPEGTELHLPTALPPKKKAARTVVEMLEYPTKMHVIKEGGTRKQAFGNAKTLEGISPSGPLYPLNTNITVVALAHVPLQDNGEDVVAGYYMDQLSLGDFVKTGRVAWEIGFNHAHLAEGHVEKVVVSKEPRPEIKEKLRQMEIEQKAAQDIAAMDIGRPEPKEPTLAQKIAKMEADQLAHPERYPDLWKASIKPLNEAREEVTFIANVDMVVKDYSTRGRDKLVPKYKGVKLKYTFEKDGILYGMPGSHMETGYWYGIPMDLLTSEDELFNTKFDLPTRVHLNASLSFTEKYVSVPLSRALNHKWLKSHVDKIKRI